MEKSQNCAQAYCQQGGEIAAVSTYITEVGSQRVLARSMALLGITCSVGVFLAQLASHLVVAVFGTSTRFGPVGIHNQKVTFCKCRPLARA